MSRIVPQLLIGVRLPPSLLKKLDREARRQKLTRSELIRMAVKEYLEW